MKNKKYLIALAALSFAAIAAFSLKDSLRTYVPFDEAMKGNRAVQIIGELDNSYKISHQADYYTFRLRDVKGTSMTIMHRGVKPATFEQSEQVVARGRFNPELRIFEAEKVLVKCPSRYVRQAEAGSHPGESE